MSKEVLQQVNQMNNHGDQVDYNKYLDNLLKK